MGHVETAYLAWGRTREEAEERVKELSVERDAVRAEIEALLSETHVIDSAEGVEIDPVGTMRRAEERSSEILMDAESVAEEIRSKAELEVAHLHEKVDRLTSDVLLRLDQIQKRMESSARQSRLSD